MNINARRAAFGFALVLLTSALAMGQTPAGAPSGQSWAAWAGCWSLVTEAGPGGVGTDRPRVCVTEVPGGARLTTTLGDKPAVEQTILTDGVDHPVDEAGCRGTQRAEWSQHGPRVYARAELSCAGDPAPRRVSGYALLAQDGTWLDIQAVEMASRDTVRVRRYRRDDSAIATRVLPGRSLGFDDLKEASAKVSSAALEAAIVETNAVIPLSGKALLDLDKAGVPGRVIDLLVAVTYPEKFVVQRSAGADRGPLPPIWFNDPFTFGYFGYPTWSSAFGFYDYGSPFYYTPFAYSYYGRYDPRFGNGGVVFVTDPGSGGGGAKPQPSGTGRAVDGRGYTQVRPREPEPVRTPATTSVSTSSTSSTASTPSGSSSTASPSGFSSGSGSSDSGRTAVPR